MNNVVEELNSKILQAFEERDEANEERDAAIAERDNMPSGKVSELSPARSKRGEEQKEMFDKVVMTEIRMDYFEQV